MNKINLILLILILTLIFFIILKPNKVEKFTGMNQYILSTNGLCPIGYKNIYDDSRERDKCNEAARALSLNSGVGSSAGWYLPSGCYHRAACFPQHGQKLPRTDLL